MSIRSSKITNPVVTEELAGNANGGKTRPRERIVSAACTLFRENGIRATGVEAIAEAADTNKMTLYRHFGSKDELICEALKCISDRHAAFWEKLTADFPDDSQARLLAWVELRAASLVDEPHGCDLSNAAVELKETDHPAHAVIEQVKAAQHRRLVDLCADAGSRDPDLLANTLAMLLEGARVSRCASGAEGPCRQFSRACHAAIAAFRN